MSNLDKILEQPAVTHDLVQGTSAWDLFRVDHRGASEAAAALGLSKKVQRNELLHAKHTGLPREFSDWLQKHVLDKGHEVEGMALPHVEKIIGESLYPLTYSRGILSASCDGITMDGAVAFEHKQWNDELAAMVSTGVVPDEHMPQCQQILLVTGAEEVYFVVSNGTPEKLVYTRVQPQRTWWTRIADGWAQFDTDLAAYVPAEVVPAPAPKIASSLPVVFDMRVEGKLVSCNLEKYKPAALAYIAAINTELTEDQHFADATTDAKFCRDSADKLELAVEQALGQMGDINTALNTVREIAAAFDAKALVLEKKVTSEKAAIKERQMQRGKDALAAHIAALNTRLGKPYMPTIAADFAGKIKNLRTVESLRNAIDTELARAKIDASATADRIDLNLRHLRENAAEYAALFPDTATIVLKAPDDLAALVSSRIGAHKAAEEKRLEAERERIRKEEVARIEREQQEKEALERRQREEEAARQAAQAATPAPTPAPVVIASPAASSPAANVVPMGTRAPAAVATPPTLKLGQIGERLGFSLSGDFLKQLGFEPAARDKSALLFHESSFPLICDALVAHVRTVAAKQQLAA